MIEELSEQCWEVRTYGPPWFDYKKFARLVARECASKCDALEDRYAQARLDVMDFTYKNQLAEGETACAFLAKDIRRLFE